ncbi:glucose-6-phosphate isomerase, archaeal [Methanoculleus bourgensis]|jgi:glucose-6-phosphate isomerase|uniref:glucose-6-phosphate isomerase family protein n=1 Tax=Methanoculleus bourgensis TaxID=83986 RepID=UPI0007BCC3BC|nr:glucose-6-phosphate isomerase, archaeal [Methanoculleus bourgensis]
MDSYWDGPKPEAQARTIEEMQDVLADPGCTSDQPLYFMYRDLARSDDDRRWLHDHHVRYDITVIPSRILCGEYVKTKGHYHTVNPAGVPYPEIYEVLSGTGHYLLQTEDASDVVMIVGSVGDKILIPPGYGHVTINPAREDLVMANLVSTEFSSNYAPYAEMRGAAYYEMEGGALVKNPRCPDAPPVRYCDPVEVPELGIEKEVGLYDLIGRPRAVAFLNHPEQFMEIFADVTGGCLLMR